MLRIRQFYIQSVILGHFINTFTIPCEKSKMVSFTSLLMKNIVVFAFLSQARFHVKSICCIAFGSAQHQVLVVSLNQLLSITIFRMLSYVLKGYLPYKTITSQNVVFEAQVKNFLFHRKVMFHSQDIQVFVFLAIP